MANVANETLQQLFRLCLEWNICIYYVGTYVIDILQNGAEPTSCANISQPVEGRMNTIITCPNFVNNVYDGVSISNEENKPLKIYEVEILGNVFAFLFIFIEISLNLLKPMKIL